jgi:uncharacterized protein YkwD
VSVLSSAQVTRSPSIASSRSGRLARRGLALTATVASLGSAVLLSVAAPAYASASADNDFLAKVNASREAHGLHPLRMVSDLHSLATHWSRYQARGGCGSEVICHNPHLASDVSNWRIVGENVGVGPNVSDIETAFMESPEHRANILEPSYTEIGIGTAIGKDGRLYVTQDFRAPMHATKHPSKHRTRHTHRTRHHATRPPVQHRVTSPTHAVSRTSRHATHRLSTSRQALVALLHNPRPRSGRTDPVRLALKFVTTMKTLAA